MSCTRLFDKGSPARLIVLTEGGMARILVNSAIAEGTVLTRVTSPAGMSANRRAFSTSTALPPEESGANISNTERSKQIEVEANTAERSAAGKVDTAQCRNVTGLACSMATPFG